MSHANITVTRTVTTTHPHAIFLNVGYLKSAAGLLKIAQLVNLMWKRVFFTFFVNKLR